MHQENANIRQLSQPLSPTDRVRKQIRAVLIVMLALTVPIAATAFFIAGPKAMLAAFFGGLSQVAAVWLYRRIATSTTEIPTPQAMLGRFMLAEVAKLITALALMIAGLVAFGANAPWFLGAAVAALAAYWLVLILK
jgi:F0F1-type ATP synthase assembly protein I